MITIDGGLIQKHIPLPESGRQAAKWTLPLRQMEIGSSFSVPISSPTMMKSLREHIQYHYAKFGRDRRYTTRRVADGVRVWRVT